MGAGVERSKIDVFGELWQCCGEGGPGREIWELIPG